MPHTFAEDDDRVSGRHDLRHERPLATRLTDLVCPFCGFRAVPEREPSRCPMCGGEEWELSTHPLGGLDDAEPPGSSIR